MKRTILIFSLLAMVILTFANEDLDSLKLELARAEGVEVRFGICVNIANHFTTINTDSANAYLNIAAELLNEISDEDKIAGYYITRGIYFMNSYKNDSAIMALYRGLNISKKIDAKPHIKNAGMQLATVYYLIRNIDSAEYYYKYVLAISDSADDPKSYAAYLNNIANVYDMEHNKDDALSFYLRALKIFQLLNLQSEAAITKNNIALIYQEMDDFKAAIKFAKEAAETNKRENNLSVLLSDYNTLSLVYRDLKLFDSATFYIQEAIHIAKSSNFKFSLAQSYHNLGSVFLDQEIYDSAVLNFNISLATCEELKIQQGIVFNLISLGQAYNELNEFDRSEKCLLEVVRIDDSLSILGLEDKAELMESIVKLYKSKREATLALEYYDKYQAIIDSLNNALLTNKIQEIQAKYETEQKEIENQRLKAENENQELIISRQRIIMVVSVISALAAILIIAMILSIRKGRKKRLIILEAKNKKIEEQSKELDKLNKTKDKLFSIISHDLRSPFSALLGFVSIIENELKNQNYDDALKYTEQLHISTKSTYDLLENLLSWSRSQQNKIVIEKTQINLNILVDSLILTLKHSADNKSVVLTNRIPHNTIISIDKNILSVVLRNLISNSIKFTDKQGIIEIISAFITKDNIKIIVRDTGIGMSEELVSKIESTEGMFSTVGTDEEEGTGLGLIMVKEFLHRLDSKLEVKSEKGKGSEFSFCLQLT